MKVLLLQDVAQLGQKGDIKEVKDGYGRNFLLARGLAKLLTPDVLQEAEALRKQRESAHILEASAFETALKNLKDKNIVIEAKANEQGGLFRAVSAKQILASLKKSGIEKIKEEDLLIKEPIKKIGIHEIEAKRGEISGKIKIAVKTKEDKTEKMKKEDKN
ncbi:MAG: 50S ribosomal protein L9 [Candidatus Niyogibacteria bacterium]|nr:MAG: 50S ribosomal protein L9 [Candidatus Niyogibacteria bacterium]